MSTNCAWLHISGEPADDAIELVASLKFGDCPVPVPGGQIAVGLRGYGLSLRSQTGWQRVNPGVAPLLGEAVAADGERGWRSRAPLGEASLQRDLVRQPLGAIANAPDWLVTATLLAQRDEIQVLAVEGLWRHNLRPNLQAVLHRKLARELAGTAPTCELAIATCSAAQPTAEAFWELAVPESLAAIIALTADTDSNFCELAAKAGLDPMVDFAVANLRGTQLNGLNLSEAALQRANLRGAELNDTDLSDANLSEANLRGADLSGAYLNGVNLQAADLHRASLALATLSGADLSNANLVGANLTGTNLGSAKVTGARFGHNPGLEHPQALRERGGLFVESEARS